MRRFVPFRYGPFDPIPSRRRALGRGLGHDLPMSTSAPGPVVPSWFREPTMGQRFLGALLDGLVLLPTLLLGAALGWDSIAARTSSLLVSAGYHVLLVARNGQTLGKSVLGTRVVSFATGDVPTLDAAAMRWVVAFGLATLVAQLTSISGLAGVIDLVVLLPILQGPLHRGLHDHAARTVVTAVRRG